jgi:hypothetical protein
VRRGERRRAPRLGELPRRRAGPTPQWVGLGDHARGRARLRAFGCAKINLQIRRDNLEAMAFYEHAGFKEDVVVSFVTPRRSPWRRAHAQGRESALREEGSMESEIRKLRAALARRESGRGRWFVGDFGPI